MTLKLFAIAVCVMGAVTADVSHLFGNADGYNYNKPSITFDVPPNAILSQQQPQLPGSTIQIQNTDSDAISIQQQESSSNEYLPPATASVQHKGNSQHISAPEAEYSSQVLAHNQKIYSDLVSGIQQQISKSHNNEYLPPAEEISSSSLPSQSSNSASDPPQHQEISQTILITQPQIPNYQKDVSQPFIPSSNEYLPPKTSHFSSTIGSANHEEIPQTILTPQLQPPVIQQQVSSNEYLPPKTQDQHEEFSQAPVYSQEVSPTFTPVLSQKSDHVSSNEYLPPQIQHSALSLNPPAIFRSQYFSNDYLPPETQKSMFPSVDPIQHQSIAKTQTQYFSQNRQQKISPSLQNTQAISEYLPPQPQHAVPAEILSNEYLTAPQIPAVIGPSKEYFMPNHQIDHHNQLQDDGYYYDVPAKSFKF